MQAKFTGDASHRLSPSAEMSQIYRRQEDSCGDFFELSGESRCLSPPMGALARLRSRQVF